MKKNYERYSKIDAQSYDSATLLSRFIGKECDYIIYNLLEEIKDNDILELGCGTGRYTKVYYKNNKVKCIDINPHLFRLNDVEIVKGNATELDKIYLPEIKFNYILSFWMTEYLAENDLRHILLKASEKLKNDGRIIITFISKELWGHLYIFGAKLKGICKYNYSDDQIFQMSLHANLSIEKKISVKKYGIEFGTVLVFKK